MPAILAGHTPNFSRLPHSTLCRLVSHQDGEAAAEISLPYRAGRLVSLDGRRRREQGAAAGADSLGPMPYSTNSPIMMHHVTLRLPGRRVCGAAALLATATCLAAWLLAAPPAAGDPAGGGVVKPHGIATRAPLTTSTVVGSPEPPPPYRVKRVYPKLKLNFPIAVAHQPGSDRLFVITQINPYGPATVGRVKDDPESSEVEKLFDVEAGSVAYDIKFHPRFAENGYVYIGSNVPSKALGGAKATRITRYVVDRKPPYRFDLGSATTIIEWASDGHNGGATAFGHDGMMYVTSGDGTSDSDMNIRGQDLSQLTAKVLRIDVDHPDPGKTYSVPKDNPFVGVKDARPETWAYGLRNPWRMTVDEKTGALWVGNNGQDLWEQAYRIEKGANYGWSVMEGSHVFYPNRKPGPTPFSKPTVEHHHSEARSLTGGVVYYGLAHPELHGVYVYGDYSTGKVWGVRHDGKRVTWHKELADTHLQITGFGTDGRGEILIADHRGEGKGGFYTLGETPKDGTPSTFPRKLSDSGLFKSVKGHEVVAGLIPYSVNAPFWSDGAYKVRYAGLPGETQADFTRGNGWNFPDRTVIVKSFALEAEAGNPESRRWIETRFLTKQDGEWYGYSYVWDDAQTDAMLVGAAGMDREYAVKDAKVPGGVRKQAWHYPSQAECMVCHSRAANFVLGLSEAQMNRDHDYGGVVDNQLRAWEHVGALKLPYADEFKASVREGAKAKGVQDKEADAAADREASARERRGAEGKEEMLASALRRYLRLADPADAKADLAARARSYLASNCAQCHVMAGGGNAQIELGFATPLKEMKLVDVKPQHHTFGLPEARLIAPGHPERSVLLHRISHRGEGHMPPLSTNVVDEGAVELMREWIRSLKPAAASGPSGGR